MRSRLSLEISGEYLAWRIPDMESTSSGVNTDWSGQRKPIFPLSFEPSSPQDQQEQLNNLNGWE